jgi:hypothetical protein
MQSKLVKALTEHDAHHKLCFVVSLFDMEIEEMNISFNEKNYRSLLSNFYKLTA